MLLPRATPFQAVEILQREHESFRRKCSDPLDLAQELGFGVGLFSDGFQLSIVFADALRERTAIVSTKMGSRAGLLSASGMCSGALLWKLEAGHLGNLPPKDLTAP
jgi:hypothetical protein